MSTTLSDFKRCRTRCGAQRRSAGEKVQLRLLVGEVCWHFGAGGKRLQRGLSSFMLFHVADRIMASSSFKKRLC